MRANFSVAVLRMLGRTIGVGALVCNLAGGAGCRGGSELETPEQTVMAFIDRMQRVHGDPERSLEAFELMARSAQSNLEERARRASAAAGRVVRPEEMLGPSRFFLEFPAVQYSTQRGSNWAIVTVEGSSPDLQREVRCRLEDGKWKVVIEFPALRPLEKSLR